LKEVAGTATGLRFLAPQSQLHCFDTPFRAKIHAAMDIWSNYRKSPLHFVLSLVFLGAWMIWALLDKHEYFAESILGLVAICIFCCARVAKTIPKPSISETAASAIDHQAAPLHQNTQTH